MRPIATTNLAAPPVSADVSHPCGALSRGEDRIAAQAPTPDPRADAGLAGPALRHALRLALFQPDIPQNAGTMLRTCACLGIGADLIEPAGFPTSDRHFRRAGLDYLEALAIRRHRSFDAFEAWRHQDPDRRLVLLTTAAETSYLEFGFRPRDILMVGRESAGVPHAVHTAAEARIGIAMQPGLRSLNVAVAAAMVLGEALRQLALCAPCAT